ncbi:MAG: abortive infection family protein [Candidatus Rokubacteria bacterium]|nr:abortive infection family protein [Candidatus Rokubacteria bacterium]
MSDLTFIEKTKLERQFQMGSGYVLDFSNRTLAEFVAESTGRDIYDAKYDYASGSKANRLRAFWTQEPNYLVGKLTTDLLEYCRPPAGDPDRDRLFEACIRIAARLGQSVPVDAIDAITPEGSERGFEVLARAVRDSIEKNEPEAGLDRLHTFVTKLIRTLSERRGLSTDRDKPLHSIFGEYVKALRGAGLIESEMTERILKSSISTMEAFNRVRNDSSFAHDNPTLRDRNEISVPGEGGLAVKVSHGWWPRRQFDDGSG